MKKTIISALGTAALLCFCQYQAQAQMLAISEVYGGGGNDNAPYKRDFIELYNYGTTSFNLSTYSVFYASDTGGFGSSTVLTGSIAPGGFYLIAEAGGSTGAALPTANVTGTINLSAVNGKVALAPTGTTGIAPSGTNVLDYVGYGDATTFEGLAAAPAGSNTTSVQRINPAVDTNQNGVDFAAGVPTPVPEPSIYAATLLGGLGVFAMRRLRQRCV